MPKKKSETIFFEHALAFLNLFFFFLLHANSRIFQHFKEEQNLELKFFDSFIPQHNDYLFMLFSHSSLSDILSTSVLTVDK